jgi:hypothetical protein
MSASTNRSWKLERASVHHGNAKRPHSNKYSTSDSHEVPAPGTRERFWVGGYTKANGTHVAGHYRNR